MLRFTLIHPNLGTFTREYSPIGWEKTQPVLERSKTYHSIIETLRNDLDFPGEYRDFLREAHDRYGVEIPVTFVVDAEGADGTWKEFYRGAVDLYELELKPREGNVDALTGERSNYTLARTIFRPNDLTVKLNAREKEPAPITATRSVDDTEISDIDLRDIPVHGKLILIGTVGEGERQIGISPTSSAVDQFYTFPATIVYDENDQGLQSITAGSFGTLAGADALFVAPRDEGYFVQFSGDFTYTYTSEYGSGSISAVVGHPGGSDSERLVNVSDLSGAGGQESGSGSFSITVDYELLQNDELRFVFSVFWNPFASPPLGETPIFDLTFEATNLRVEVLQKSEYPPTSAKGMLIHEYAAKTLEYILDRPNVLISEALGRVDSEPRSYAQNGCYSLYAATNGLQLRGFVDGKKPAPHWLELWRAMDAAFCLGFGIEKIGGENYAVIEDRKHFYQPQVWNRYDFVKDIGIKVASEYYYNSVEFGFKKYENDAFNSLDSPHGDRIFTNFLTNRERYTSISDYLACTYAIEITRREQFAKKATKGTKYDEDYFWLSLTQQIKVEIKGTNGDGTSLIVSAIHRPTPTPIIASVIIKNAGTWDGTYTPTTGTISTTDEDSFGISPALPNTDFAGNVGPDSYAIIVLQQAQPNAPTYYSAKDEGFNSVTGMIDPSTTHNLKLTPTRLMLRHSRFHSAGMLKYPSRQYKFSEGEANYDLRTDLANGCLDDYLDQVIPEGADFDAEYLLDPLFDPVIIEATVPMPLSDWLSLRTYENKYRLIGLSDTDGDHLYGWILRASYNRADQLCDLKLIKKNGAPEAFPVPPSLPPSEPPPPPPPPSEPEPDPDPEPPAEVDCRNLLAAGSFTQAGGITLGSDNDPRASVFNGFWDNPQRCPGWHKVELIVTPPVKFRVEVFTVLNGIENTLYDSGGPVDSFTAPFYYDPAIDGVVMRMRLTPEAIPGVDEYRYQYSFCVPDDCLGI